MAWGKLRAALLPICLATAAAAAEPSRTDCLFRVNDRPQLLAACIQADWVRQHLVAFQRIADANPDAAGHGNRDAGTPGYRASVGYVERVLRRAGYAVRRQPYRFTYRAAADARITIGGRPAQAWHPATNAGTGHARGALRRLPPGRAGCQGADYAGLPPGAIVVLPEGSCAADDKIAAAEAAGAAAVLLSTAGTPRPVHLTHESHVPVLSAAEASLPADPASAVAIDLATTRVTVDDLNLIAESPHGDPAHTIDVEGHLDSIYGPGILDNASGAASILEVALMLARTDTPNRLRYVFFGGEELGLHGSRHYVATLTPAERAAIAFDLDVDVTATPNFDLLVADPGHAPDRRRFPEGTIAASAYGNDLLLRAFAEAGLPARLASFGNEGTDSHSYALAGIPNTGVLTQQNCCKRGWETRIWGGFPGNYEGQVPGRDGGCVDTPGRWCDTLANTNNFVLGLTTRAVAITTLRLAQTDFAGARRK